MMSETTIIILTAIICITILFCAVLYTSMKKAVESEAEALMHFLINNLLIMNDNMWEVTTKTKEK